MKILMIVISSDTYPVYSKHREVWRTYMKSNPNIDCYFIQYRSDIFVPILTKDTLYLRGFERYGTIYKKTIEALKYLLPRQNYTYICRTNLSSVWNFPNYIKWLETQSPIGLYAGQTGMNKETGIEFASGCGFTMSTDVCRKLIEQFNLGMHLNAFDDVAIAYVLKRCGISPVPQPRVDFISLQQYTDHYDKIPTSSFHFRVKHQDYLGDRMEEPVIMQKLVSFTS